MSVLNCRFARRPFKALLSASPLPISRRCTIPRNPNVFLIQNAQRHLTSLAKSPPVLGIVDTVATDSIIVKALSNASVGALVVFQNGAYGTVTEIRKNDVCRVSLLNGTVIPTETAVVEQSTIQIGASPSYIGRVINVLGEPMDGLGPIHHAPSKTGFEYVNTNASPSITDRRSPSGALATGIKAIDAFRPILHGQSVLIMGESGTGKRAFLGHVLKNLAKHNNNQLLASEALDTDPTTPLRFVYVFAGHSERYIQEQLLQMRLDYVLPYTTVVAAPSSSPPANQYLAPFTGMAIANHFRERGEHVVVFLDSLSASATASRKMSGFAFSKLNIPQSGLASILDKCGTAVAKHACITTNANNDDHVGSVTLFATYDMPIVSTTAGFSEKDRYVRMDGNYLRSLADNVLETDANQLKKGNFFSFQYKQLIAGDGGSGTHVVQGPGLHHVATRGKLVLLEAEEAARNAEDSLELGIEPTAEKDIILDMHKKAKLLLYPTLSDLHELQQLQAQHGSKKGSSSTSDSFRDATGTNDSFLLSGTVQKRAFLTVTPASRSFLPPVNFLRRGAFFSTTGDDNEVISRFSEKLSPEQMKALMAVRGSRRPSTAARFANANLKPSIKGSTVESSSTTSSKQEDDRTTTTSSESKIGDTKAPKKPSSGFNFSGLYGGSDNPSRQFSTFSSMHRTSFHYEPGSSSRPFSIFSRIKDNFTTRVVDNESEIDSQNKLSSLGEESPIADETHALNNSTCGNSSRRRLPFRPPEGKIAQPQLFQSVCAAPFSQLAQLNLDQPSDRCLQSIGKENGTDDLLELMASVELPANGWVAEPFLGDAQRIFLDLFLLSHTYVAPVPLARIYEYEKGLFDLLSVLPSSKSLYSVVKRRQQEKSAELSASEEKNEVPSLSDGKIPLSKYFSLLKRFEEETLPFHEQQKNTQTSQCRLNPFSGLLTLPLSSIRSEYTDGTLLDAILQNPIPEMERTAVNHDITTMVRIANNKILQHVSLDARRERLKQKIVEAKDAVIAKQQLNEKKRKSWFSLPPLKPGYEEELLDKAVEDAEREYKESLESTSDPVFGLHAPAGLRGIGGHLRLSPITDFHDLPPDWQVLHVVVAEYTRKFCALPRL